MKALTVAIALTLLTSSGLSAKNDDWAYFFNAKQLNSRCSSPNAQDQAVCEAYIAGVFDALSATSDVKEDAGRLARCTKRKFSLGEARRAVAQWLTTKLAESESREMWEDFPASRDVIGSVSVYVCEDSDARFDAIARELGAEPPRGTPEFDEYAKVLGCMYVAELSQGQCRDIVRGARD